MSPVPAVQGTDDVGRCLVEFVRRWLVCFLDVVDGSLRNCCGREFRPCVLCCSIAPCRCALGVQELGLVYRLSQACQVCCRGVVWGRRVVGVCLA